MKIKFFILKFILIFSLLSCGNPSSGDHFVNSINLINDATRISNSGSAYSEISAEDMATILDKYRRALKEARMVEIGFLNKHLSGLGDQYEELFIRGVEMYINGYENSNDSLYLTGQVLLDRWGEWYSTNLEKISSPENR